MERLKMEAKKIMFIGAHPDDIELSCAGLILNLKNKGKDVFCVIASWGDYGGTVSDRISEQEKSFTCLGIPEYVNLGWPDTEISVDGRNIKKLEEIISEQNPDLIFTHWPEDTHQDHRSVAEMVKSICYRKNKNLIYFDSNSSLKFSPNYYEKIDWEEKKSILEIFHSQASRSKIIERAEMKARNHGMFSETGFAEGYIIERIINI